MNHSYHLIYLGIRRLALGWNILLASGVKCLEFWHMFVSSAYILEAFQMTIFESKIGQLKFPELFQTPQLHFEVKVFPPPSCHVLHDVAFFWLCSTFIARYVLGKRKPAKKCYCSWALTTKCQCIWRLLHFIQKPTSCSRGQMWFVYFTLWRKLALLNEKTHFAPKPFAFVFDDRQM